MFTVRCPGIPTPNTQSRGRPLDISPRLLIQYIHSYPLYLQAFTLSATRRCKLFI